MEWKPKAWLAGLLGILITPFSMLYVQRPWLALGYFCASTAVAIGRFLTDPSSVTGATIGSLLSWGVSFACALQAYCIARDSKPVARDWYSQWYGLTGIALVAVLSVFGVRAFWLEPFRMPSVSMHPSVPQNSIVLVDKRGFGHYGSYGIELLQSQSTAAIARGDLVIFRLADRPQLLYLKRVVAIAGDHISYSDRHMTLNGEPVPITLGERTGPYQLATEVLDGRTIGIAFMPERAGKGYAAIVPAGRFVVFGDSRDNARDSRYLGMIHRRQIMGRVVKVL
jgi:signal peptidase I